MPEESTLRALPRTHFAEPPIFWQRPFHLALRRRPFNALFALRRILLAAVLVISSTALIYPQEGNPSVGEIVTLSAQGTGGSLREQVPSQFRERYDRWKATFLSADAGRQLWLRYAANPAFSLTIIVSKKLGGGAKIEVGDFQWNEGKLVAATMILGHQLDKGYPARVYYPVIGSLAFTRAGREGADEDVLAAAKIAHEFGHIDQTANSDAAHLQSQNEISQDYISHLISNGYKTDDAVLLDLASSIGGTPLEITAQREYWAETYALRYLLDKLAAKNRRELLGLVQKSLASEPMIYYLPSQTEWLKLACLSCFKPFDRRPAPAPTLSVNESK